MRVLPIILVIFALASGCGGGAVLQGYVVDARGQGLPGVAVRVEGTPFEALTNGVGEYRVRYRPQDHFVVTFAKTGYTPFTWQKSETSVRVLRETTPIMLTQLPDGPGVYLYENYDYTKTTIDTAETKFQRKNDENYLYGTLKEPVETLKRNPSLVIYRGYKIPPYGVKLNRLEQTEIKPLPGYTEGSTAWVRGPEIPIEVHPIDAKDAADAQLLQIWFTKELDLGAYAVHWGALDGDVSLNEPRLFCFKVVEQLTPTVKPEETAPEAKTAEAKPGDKKAPEKKAPASPPPAPAPTVEPLPPAGADVPGVEPDAEAPKVPRAEDDEG